MLRSSSVLLILFSITGFAQTDSVTSSVPVETEEAVVEHSTKLLESDEAERIPNYFDEDDTIKLYTEGFEGLHMLDETVKNHRVFITGENHTYTESNARLWLKMIKYLHEHAGVRNIMFEYGYSYGFLVNEYLKTGDSTLFSSIDQFAYIEYSNALEDLKKYNDSLPEDEKLYFAAIDIERGVYPIAKVLAYLIPQEGEAHDSISLHIQSIQSLAAYNDFKLDQQDEGARIVGAVGFNFRSSPTLDLVHKNFLKFESEYKAYLGDEFDRFKRIIVDNYIARKQYQAYESAGAIQEYIYRENYMHKRFLEEADAHEGNWFGQFGRCHTTLTKQSSNSCDWFEFNSLADRIENTEGGEFKDKVMSIAILYENDRKTGHDRDSLMKQFDEYFDDIEENSVVLFDMSIDSILNKAYGHDFKYIFLNTNTAKGEVYEYLADGIEDYDFDFDFKFAFSYGIQEFNFSEINAAVFESRGFAEEFDNMPRTIGFSMMGGSDGYTSGMDVGIYIRDQKIDEGAVLSGFYFKDVAYVNVLKNMELLDLHLGGAIGFHRLKVVLSESLEDPNAPGTFIGLNRNTVYTNPALTFDLSMIVDVNLGPFTVGMKMGRIFDASKKHWLTDGEPVVDSPNTSFGGQFSAVRVGMNF